ncbi:hypothetical protein LU196_09615 [Pantoea sp. Mb-10]|uniref:hypothetical protein n=1 Tax=unclassified Pantoea TaxID=2630326 RepID=UPI001E2C9BFC|nr:MULTISPECIES: hypothetical protein [unclassified Pantoea]MCE0490305.1 hypothetical protein [Pantoea sp. Mb-10]MCE0501436.1 hypothetical protein [Pantoea sp. Pb-8]
MIVEFKLTTKKEEEKKPSNHKDNFEGVVSFKSKSASDEEKIIQSIITRAENLNW